MLSTSSELPLGELSSRRRARPFERIRMRLHQYYSRGCLFFYLLLNLDEHDQAMIFWPFLKITSYLVAPLHLIPTASKANFGLLFAFGFCKRYNVNIFLTKGYMQMSLTSVSVHYTRAYNYRTISDLCLQISLKHCTLSYVWFW